MRANGVFFGDTCLDPQEFNVATGYTGIPTHMRIAGRKVPVLQKGYDRPRHIITT